MSPFDSLYTDAVKKAWIDRQSVKDTLKKDTEIEIRFDLPFIAPSLIRNVRCTRYTEDRYLHPEYPHVKIRRRNHASMVSKTRVSSYSLEPHWSKLCVSIESIYTSHEIHRLYPTEHLRVECYTIPIHDVAVMEIKHIPGKKDSLEIEFIRHDDRAKEIVRSAAKTVLQQCIVPYMNRTRFTEMTLPIDPEAYPRPVTLQRSMIKDLFASTFYVTVKNDGDRVFLLIRGDTLYEASYARPYFRPIARNHTHHRHLLLDCERVGQTYYLLDYDDFTHTTFEQRMTHFDTLVPFTTTKTYRRVHTLQDIIEYRTSDLPKNDGLLLIDGTRTYRDSVIYKWKYRNTIDLLVRDQHLYMNNDIEFTDLPCPRFAELDNNAIYEFLIDASKSYIVPVRRRDDKIRPNSAHVVRTNLYHGVTLDDIEPVGCLAMRRFHHHIKKECLDTLTSDVLLDIGTGQGADVPKWDDRKTVYCIEPNDTMVRQLRRRSRHKANVHIIHGTLNDEVIELFRTQRIDVVTFFCLNLFSDHDFRMLDRLFSTVDVDRWIAIFMDYNRVVETFSTTKYACTDYTIKADATRTYIDIPHSKVNDLIEHRLTLDDLVAHVPSMRLISHTYLSDPLLTEHQNRLSSCYCVATFSKGSDF